MKEKFLFGNNEISSKSLSWIYIRFLRYGFDVNGMISIVIVIKSQTNR